ncbi:MAG TPA: hypothetical protein VFY71_15840 [Planctomycetota bacterium]|nr:hypothetical protein [Planctomycetota bacterium]
MSRVAGPLLLLLLVLVGAGLRLQESARSERLQQGEAAALATLADLQQACRELVSDGNPRSDLARAALAALPALRPLQGPSTDAIAYATNDAYVYGLASQTRRDERSGHLAPGWILRAWPARFGVTGNREFQVADDGQAWEGQNRLGRSGTDYAFPPDFPDPEIGQPRTPWWPVELPAHK